ncbi:MAG: PCMD domain-containing protein [Porphyromonadaceae bacterium]|nr:PCMD domain-containing protein [Porphyromonadaceae bacterium]
MLKNLVVVATLFTLPGVLSAQEEIQEKIGPTEVVELIPYGDMESWTTRIIKEAAILGGARKEIYQIGPEQTIKGGTAWTRESSDSPWGCSSVWANPMGIDKLSVSVFPEEREPGNRCARLEVIKDAVKAVGMVNITVVATGSVFIGGVKEPVKNAKNPQGKLDQGMPFTGHPKALQLDYTLHLADHVIKATGGRSSEIEGKDTAEIRRYLIQRWEDEEGNIYAKRVGTAYCKLSESTPDWVNGFRVPIYYGDISGESYFTPDMELLLPDGPRYATNSKGKNVPIQMVGWADADTQPTHLMLRISSSDKGAYIGAVGTCLWIDNVSLVY